MSTLKQLRLRISGVKSTQKITKTMQMVSASKLIKAQDQKEKAQPYASKMDMMASHLIKSASLESETFSLLTGTGKENVHLLVVVNSDRGLCGGFNSSITKYLKQHIKALEVENKTYKIICFGKKVFEHIKSLYGEQVIEVEPGFGHRKITYDDAQEVASTLLTLFEQNEFDVCTVIYTEFHNALKQSVGMRKIIPLSDLANKAEIHEDVYESEPSNVEVLKKILPLNIAVQIFYILLDSIASEHGARMTAMDAATKNAKDMINKLSLQYNRSRQAAITKELIEIISSAEVI